jgi:hypothetical protein
LAVSNAVSQNQVPQNPELKDLLDLFQKKILLGLNCHHIGTIRVFNPTLQTATVEINYKKTFFKPDATGVYRPEAADYPLAIDCPVICPGGGDGALTFPVAPGDECLLLFNDRDIDTWFQGNTGAPPATLRLHAFSDAIALVGVRSAPNVIPGYAADRAELRTKTGLVKVSVGATDVKIETPAIAFEIDSLGKLKITNEFGELVAILDALYQAIAAGTAAGFNFVLPPTFATNLALLQTFKAI